MTGGSRIIMLLCGGLAVLNSCSVPIRKAATGMVVGYSLWVAYTVVGDRVGAGAIV